MISRIFYSILTLILLLQIHLLYGKLEFEYQNPLIIKRIIRLLYRKHNTI